MSKDYDFNFDKVNKDTDSSSSNYVRKRRSKNSAKPASDYFYEKYGKNASNKEDSSKSTNSKKKPDPVIYDDSQAEDNSKKKAAGTAFFSGKGAKADKPAKDTKPAKKKKKKSVSIFSLLSTGQKAAIAVVLLLILVGVGVFFYWDRKPPELSVKEGIELTYGTSVNVTDLIAATDNRAKEVKLSIDSISPDGAFISEDGKSITFEKVGTYELKVTGTDDFKNKTSFTATLDVKDSTAPNFIEIADSYDLAYGKEISIENVYTPGEASVSPVPTDSSEATNADGSTAVIDMTDSKGAINTESSEETKATDKTEEEETFDKITVSANDEVTANVNVCIASLKPLEDQGKDSYELKGDKIIFKELGDYDATVQAIDESGNSVVRAIKIHVIDKTKPTFESIKDSYERPYGKEIRAVKKNSDNAKDNDIKVSAKDEKSKTTVAITKVTPKGKLDDESYSLKDGTLVMKKMGTYEVTITAKDASDNKVSKKVTIKTLDGKAPEFSGIPSSITLTTDDTSYNWTQGVKAYDEVDGNISNYIDVDSSEVKFGKAGEYTITYSVADTANNGVSKSILVYIKQAEKPTTAAKNNTTAAGDKKKTN